MRTTIAVEPHAPANFSTTVAASAMEPPPPPAPLLVVRPIRPIDRSASRLFTGNSPFASTAPAFGDTTSDTTRSSASTSTAMLSPWLQGWDRTPAARELLVGATAQLIRPDETVTCSTTMQHAHLLHRLAVRHNLPRRECQVSVCQMLLQRAQTSSGTSPRRMSS